MEADSEAVPSSLVELIEGEEMPSVVIGPITRTDIVRYAGAGGDFNPIHHDEEFARSAGFPGVFSMGMLQGGVLAQRLARWVGPLNVLTLSVRFTAQVWPGDELTITGRVRRIDQLGTERHAHLELAVTRQAGDPAVTAKATVRVA
jgi:acyl dehydratase